MSTSPKKKSGNRWRQARASAKAVAQQPAVPKGQPLDLRLFVHSDSRKPFAEEAPVVATAHHAAQVVAKKYGKPPGAAMFRDTAQVTVAAPVHPQAVDLARAAISKLTGVNDLKKALTVQMALSALNNQAATKAMRDVEAMRHRLEQTKAGPAVFESLRRLGINV